ncbi:MAG: hypothetical protein HQK52_00985 [Oligoflexia bacterium]|nr:hypothetical protein [Oligoflexia bacterium]
MSIQATKIPLQTLHGWLSGSEPRSVNHVSKMAIYFNVSLDYIYYGLENRSSKFIADYQNEINTGIFEVVLHRIKTKN